MFTISWFRAWDFEEYLISQKAIPPSNESADVITVDVPPGFDFDD